MKFWEFSEELQLRLVETHFSKHGSLVDVTTSPHASIYVFDRGEHTYPRCVVAKSPRIHSEAADAEVCKYITRFIQEINNANQVWAHPFIQNFSDIKLLHGLPFVFSVKRHHTLEDLISAGELTEIDSLAIAIQIAHAMSYAAQYGIVCHQDLKPANIFIDVPARKFDLPPDHPINYEVRIADFELANALFVLGRPYGSRPYLAPEQMEAQPTIRSRDFSKVDVFALGVILFEMLCGGLHPIGKVTADIWPHQADGESGKWKSERPWRNWIKGNAEIAHVPDDMDRNCLMLIRDCLAVDSSIRPSKDEVEGRLLRILRHSKLSAYENLRVLLDYYDSLAIEAAEGGWPHYETLVRDFNTWADSEFE